MNYKKKYKSHSYLEYIGEQRCCITGELGADIHHESVTHKYSAGLKKYFDFGAIPLIHKVHIDERHGWGKTYFWNYYNKDPRDVVRRLLQSYILLGFDDLAEEALELVDI